MSMSRAIAIVEQTRESYLKGWMLDDFDQRHAHRIFDTVLAALRAEPEPPPDYAAVLQEGEE